MRILLLGGSGLISTGVLKHLLARGQHEPVEITCLNRGQSAPRSIEPLPESVRQIHADRNDIETLLKSVEKERFDVVIDMICFTPPQAEVTVKLCRQVQARHLLFCSTVCTYGTEIPPHVVVDEACPQNPTSDYGKNKLACEQIMLDAGQSGDFATTVIRPSNTYGEGGGLIDNLEPDPPTWQRIREGLPVPVAGDGLALWNSTHRDDVGKLFAYAALREVTFGQCYNATTQRVFTWRDYYREAAGYFGKPAKLVFLPRDWIVAQEPKRFGLLREITGYHGAYTSAAAMHDVPEFRCDIPFTEGSARTLRHLDETNRLKPAQDDLIDTIIARAMAMGIRPVEA